MRNLLLWLQLVCVETANGSTPSRKDVDGVGRSGTDGCPRDHPGPPNLGWGRRKPARAGELSGERDSSRCLRRDKSVVTLTPV